MEHQQIVVVESPINGNQAFFALLDALYDQFTFDLMFGGADRIKLILIDFLQNLANNSSKDEANQFYQDIVITYLNNKKNKKNDTNTGAGIESSDTPS